MKKKLENDEYHSVKEFIDDIHLFCDNSILYNGKQSLYALIAFDIKKEADSRFAKKAESQEDEWRAKLKNVANQLKEHIENFPSL